MTIVQNGAAGRNTKWTSLVVLAAVNLAFLILFFQVVRPFLLPLFLAAVVALLIEPIDRRLTGLLGNRAHLSATLVTLVVLLLLIAPLALGAYFALIELTGGLNQLAELSRQGKLEPLFDPRSNPEIARAIEKLESVLGMNSEQFRAPAIAAIRATGEGLYHRTVELLSDVPGFLVGAALFIFALYYFLADGDKILSAWGGLTPLDLEHDRIIRAEFTKVCRGVVWATLAAAVVQGLLLGAGLAILELFFHIGTARWIFLLSLATMAFSMVPFVGAFAVWGPLAAYFAVRGHYLAAVLLALHGMLVISMADNLIKILVLRDSANLHPLLVFVCVFGGIEYFGILGIFIGPMVGAVLFALLRILGPLLREDDPSRVAVPTKTGAIRPVSPAGEGQGT